MSLGSVSDTNAHGSTVLVVGATSAIARATARRWAVRGYNFYLVARSAERLEALTADLRVRGAAAVVVETLDANDIDSHEALVGRAVTALGKIDIALIAHGTLGDQRAGERDFRLALQEINTNAISVMSLATHLANRLEAQGSGCLAVIGSVAGDRGRQSNYIYGTAKGAVSIFFQGLRQRLHKAGVQVLTVKPGFVDTPITVAFRKGMLWAQPEAIARAIERAVDRRQMVVYAPFFWRAIMAVIRGIPERMFVRMKL